MLYNDFVKIRSILKSKKSGVLGNRVGFEIGRPRARKNRSAFVQKQKQAILKKAKNYAVTIQDNSEKPKSAEEGAKESFEKLVALEAPVYVNSTPVLTVGGVDFLMWDVCKAALCARMNLGIGGNQGMGKSQLVSDIKALFGNNANYVLGRNDLDINSLFRQMNFNQLTKAMEKGGSVSQKEISQITQDIYRPLTIVEEINRCAEIVQNQLFNVFEGFIELTGTKYSIGKGELRSFKAFDGSEYVKNIVYSVGIWTANFGNGKFSGTVSMDAAMSERSHLIINEKNFRPGAVDPTDLDTILFDCEAEIRLKDQNKPEDYTKDFANAFSYLKQNAKKPNPLEFGEEVLIFRYLVQGLDYIPCAAADNSKTIMDEVWPSKAEENDIGSSEDEVMMYRMVYPASIRSAMTIISFARALRAYAQAKKPESNPGVSESIVQSFKLIAPYSGIINNSQRITEDYVGNPYKAGCKVGDIVKQKLDNTKQLRQAIIFKKYKKEPFEKPMRKACEGEYKCWL